MKLSVSGAIDDDREMAQRVRKANQILEKMGPTSQAVTAEWATARNAEGGSRVLLTLFDDTGVRVETGFSPEEMANEGRFLGKLYRIWGDLLQDRSHKMLDAMLSGARSGE